MDNGIRVATGATVEFEHVSKQYDVRAKGTPGAVNDLSLKVPAGKICVLVGPSGCGKTTSLKMVNRLFEPTSGRILIDGEDVARKDVTKFRQPPSSSSSVPPPRPTGCRRRSRAMSAASS